MKPIESILKKHCPSMDILFLDQQGREFRSRIFDAMKEYSSICVKAYLDKASENILQEVAIYDRYGESDYCKDKEVQESITNKSNIVLL